MTSGRRAGQKEWKSFEEERAGARQKALVLLTDMDRTEAGLAGKLKSSGFSEEAVADAISYVKGFGYLDDERYARHFLEVSGSRKSRKRMEYDLLRKGLSREVIDEAMRESDLQDERPLIRELTAKKLRTLDREDPRTKQRLAGFLSRRGFRIEDILSVLEDLPEL